MFLRHHVRVSVVLTCLSLLLIFSSCHVTDSPPNEGLPVNEILPVEGNLVFCVEKVGENQIQLRILSEKLYSCANNEIKTKLLLLNNYVRIKLLHITEPAFCLRAYGPAQANLFLNLVEGEYFLSFEHNGVYDTYRLKIRDSQIEVSEIKAFFTSYSSGCPY